MKVSKVLYIKAPNHEAVYASGQSYADNRKNILLETVRHEAVNTRHQEIGGMGFYSPLIYCRRSADNGSTWETLNEYREDLATMDGEHQYGRIFFLDPQSGMAVAFKLRFTFSGKMNHRETFSDAGCYSRTFRIFYELSGDSGKTWEAELQVIAAGAEYDNIHWGPRIYYGKSSALIGTLPISDGKGGILLAAVANLNDGSKYQSCIIHGTWNSDFTALAWKFSNYISLSPAQSSQGACEPSLCPFGENRIFVSLRACGDRLHQTFPSRKYWVISEDGGNSFTAPQMLTYEDGSPVESPSSYAGIIRSSVNGKYYYIANILNHPTYHSGPRDPLCIAELIPDKGIILKKSVTLIDTDRDGVERRRYTNFGHYEDRQTGEIVLTLPEQPKTSWQDFTADCYQYKVKVE